MSNDWYVSLIRSPGIASECHAKFITVADVANGPHVKQAQVRTTLCAPLGLPLLCCS